MMFSQLVHSTFIPSELDLSESIPLFLTQESIVMGCVPPSLHQRPASFHSHRGLGWG